MCEAHQTSACKDVRKKNLKALPPNKTVCPVRSLTDFKQSLPLTGSLRDKLRKPESDSISHGYISSKWVGEVGAPAELTQFLSVLVFKNTHRERYTKTPRAASRDIRTKKAQFYL